MRILSRLRLLVLVVGLSVVFLLSPHGAQAETNGLLISFSTNTTAPVAYSGKKLATRGQEILFTATLVEGDRVIDPSSVTIRWSTPTKTLAEGLGVSTISFTETSIVRSEVTLRARATYQGRSYETLVTVPLVTPHLVVEAPYPNLVIPNQFVTLRAVPYFFPSGNVISFEWKANGAPLSADESTTAITFEGEGSGSNVFITATAQTATFLRDLWSKTFRLE